MVKSDQMVAGTTDKSASPPLDKARSVIGICCVSLCLVLLFTARSEAGDGLLGELFNGLLGNGNSQVFVAFERELVFPPKLTSGQEFLLESGQKVVVGSQTKSDYVLFCKDGAHFLTAFSRQRPLRKLGDVISADDLSGFDGVSYWRLTLNSPTELRTQAQMADLSLPPLKSINHLTIIPKTEAERKQGLFQADAQLAAINGFAGECLSVVQFGFAQELRRALQVDAGTLKLQGSGKRNLIATIKGESAHPTELSYGEPTGQKTTTTFDYERNTLAIKRSAGGKVFFESRYHLLGVGELPQTQGSSLFAWQSYEYAATNLEGTIISNGATLAVDFTESKSIILGSILNQPRATDRRHVSKPVVRVVVFTLFLGIPLVAVIINWRTFRTKTNNERGRT